MNRSGRSLRRPLTALLTASAMVLTWQTAAQGQVPGPAWTGDFQTGNLAQWADVHSARPDAVTVVSSPARPGYASAAKFEVRPGDNWYSADTERAEVMTTKTNSAAVEGQEAYYAWSALFPVGTRVQRGGWMSVTQWHQDAHTCPANVAFFVTDSDVPRLNLSIRGGSFDPNNCSVSYRRSFDLGPLPTGAWTDFTVRSRWSADPAKGLIEVKMGGRTVVPATAVANLYNGQGAYLKQGLYGGSAGHTTTMFLTGTVRGATAESVALRNAAPAPTTTTAPAPAPTTTTAPAPAPTTTTAPAPAPTTTTAPAPAPTTTTAPAPAPTTTTTREVNLGEGLTCRVALRDAPRTADQLVVYEAGGGLTGANAYGTEASVTDSVVREVRTRQTGMTVPWGGFVVSGHGDAEQWLAGAALVGGKAQLVPRGNGRALVCMSR